MNPSKPFATEDEEIIGIVDDEADITQLFKDALYQNIEDVSLVSFNDSAQALEHFSDNKNRYALIISDLKMPNLSGLELLKRVKGENPKVRTVLISAFEGENDAVFQQYLKAGIIDKFLQKPIKISVLCREVKDQIHSFRSMNIV